MLTSRRTRMQPAGGFGTASKQLRARLVPEAELRGFQHLPHSYLGKLSQVPPARGPQAA